MPFIHASWLYQRIVWIIPIVLRLSMCDLSMRGNLNHWSKVMYVCINKLTSIGSDNGLSTGWYQAIIWTNTEILLIGLLGTNFSEILIKIHTFLFRKMHLEMMSGKCQPFCLSLNILNHYSSNKYSVLFLFHRCIGGDSNWGLEKCLFWSPCFQKRINYNTSMEN